MKYFDLVKKVKVGCCCVFQKTIALNLSFTKKQSPYPHSRRSEILKKRSKTDKLHRKNLRKNRLQERGEWGKTVREEQKTAFVQQKSAIFRSILKKEFVTKKSQNCGENEKNVVAAIFFHFFSRSALPAVKNAEKCPKSDLNFTTSEVVKTTSDLVLTTFELVLTTSKVVFAHFGPKKGENRVVLSSCSTKIQHF